MTTHEIQSPIGGGSDAGPHHAHTLPSQLHHLGIGRHAGGRALLASMQGGGVAAAHVRNITGLL
jgi:hypothetical protein